MSKYSVGLKTLLLQGLSEHEFYGDLVYKFSVAISVSPHVCFILDLILISMFLR